MEGNKKVIAFLGSSVTYGFTTGGFSFIDVIEDKLGCDVIKEAVSGTTLTDEGEDSYVKRLKRRFDSQKKVDHFVIQLSTNDITKNMPLGKIETSFDIDAFDTKTILGAMEYIIAYVKGNFHCPVTFYTNPNFHSKPYEELIHELYLLKEKWNIGILDFYFYKDMEPLSENILSKMMSDSIHPNHDGYEWIGGVFADYFKKVDKNH